MIFQNILLPEVLCAYIHQLLTFNLICALFLSLSPSLSPEISVHFSFKYLSMNFLRTKTFSHISTTPSPYLHPRRFHIDTVHHLIQNPVLISPVVPGLYNFFFYPGSCIRFCCHVTLVSFNLEQFSRYFFLAM